MKLGFIGYGKSTNRYHMPFVDASNQFDVIGYYTRGSRTFEMPYTAYNQDLVRFNSLDDLLASDVDLIVVTTPAHCHFDHAKQAILAGKHVIVEKPFCDTLEQAKALYALAKEHQVKITPYQNRRYDSDFLTIKKVLERDDLGKVFEIESNHTHYRPDGAHNSGNKYDGSVYGHAVHFIDQIVSLYGEPDDVLYDITNHKNFYIGEGLSYQDPHFEGKTIPEDYYNITLIYGNLRIRVRHSQLIVNDPPRWIVNGTQATVEKYHIDQQERDLKKGIFLNEPTFGHDHTSGICRIYFRDEASESGQKIEEIPAEYPHYTQFYLDAKAWLEGKKEAPVSKQQALVVMNILETIVNHQKYQALRD